MIAVVAALFALGCALVASDIALGLFAIAYEFQRARDLDAPLASRELLDNTRLAFWGIGLVAGGLLFWRWHARDEMLANPSRATSVARWSVFTLAPAGAVHAGYMLTKNISLDAMLAGSFAGLLAGVVLVIAYYDRMRPVRHRIGRGILSGLCAVALIWMWLAFDKGLLRPFSNMDQSASVWFMIRMPEGATDKPDRKSIGVELRTPAGVTRGFASEWLNEDGRLVLRANVDLKERNRDRTLVVTIPDRPALVYKLPFPSNPAPTYNYGSYRPLDAIEDRDGTKPAAGGFDYPIKYMVTR